MKTDVERHRPESGGQQVEAKLGFSIGSRADWSGLEESARGRAHSETLARALDNPVDTKLKKFGRIRVNPTESDRMNDEFRMTNGILNAEGLGTKVGARTRRRTMGAERQGEEEHEEDDEDDWGLRLARGVKPTGELAGGPPALQANPTKSKQVNARGRGRERGGGRWEAKRAIPLGICVFTFASMGFLT